MDPNTTLRELRDAVVQLGRLNTPDAPDDVYVATNTVIERWSALDAFISNGGFFPSEWTEAQRRALENTRPAAAPTVEEVLDELKPDPWRNTGPYFAGGLTAAEVLGSIRRY